MKNRKLVFLGSSLTLFLAVVGCGGSSSTTTTTTTTTTPSASSSPTSKVTGTVPGTLIEVLCRDGSYYKVNSTDDGTTKHPFSIELPKNVDCKFIMTTNEKDVDTSRHIVTPLLFKNGNTTSSYFKLTDDTDIGFVPLSLTGTGVQTPLVVETKALEVNTFATDPLDTDNDGIPNIYEDDDNDGIVNIYDNDDDGDGIADKDESTYASDSDGDGIENRYDRDDDNDGIEDSKDDDHVNNNDLMKKELGKYLEKYIGKPSQLRNRIAHGQWKHIVEYDIFEEEKTEEEKKKRITEKKLKDLNSFDIMKEFEIHTIIGKMIRDLVQSPNKAFLKNYTNYVNELENYLEKIKNRNIHTKIKKLKKRSKESKCPKCGFIDLTKEFTHS